MSYSVEPLGSAHDLGDCDCGNSDLTLWLHRHAHHASRQGTRTYVMVADDTGKVSGYFAVAPHLLERQEAPKKIGRGAPKRIPAILLAKLALDRSLQGKGLGSELLIKALEQSVEAARAAGGKLVIVDAIDEAAVRFYERHDFERMPGDPRRLVKKLSSVAAALELPWP